MGKETKIEWCDSTWNPWLGCAACSPGCRSCYAERLMDTRWGRVEWGVDGTRVKTSESYWRQPYQWNAEAEKAGVRAKVFCGSLCDVFEDRSDVSEWREEMFQIINRTPWLNWLLLTKRPENIIPMTLDVWKPYVIPDNIWLGVSVENERTLRDRTPLLLEIPVRLRFLSVEPLLEQINLVPYLWGNQGFGFRLDKIHWVIVSGESGPRPRPFDLYWAGVILQDCQHADVPVFVKQVGSNPVWYGEPPLPEWKFTGKGNDPDEWPEWLRVREFPGG